MTLLLSLVFADIAPECVGPEPLAPVSSLTSVMDRVGKGIPFIRGTDYVQSLSTDPKVRDAISEKCAKALEEAKGQGDFFVQSLFDQSTPIDEFPFDYSSGFFGDPTHFYHYADDSEFLDLFRVPTWSLNPLHWEHYDRESVHESMVLGGDYARIFDYNRRGSGHQGLFFKVLFVAEDPYSSQYYGSHRLNLWLHPKARVLRARYDKRPVYREIKNKFPALVKACHFDELIIPFAEGSGVALYDYINTKEWFTLTSFGFVTKTLPELNVR